MLKLVNIVKDYIMKDQEPVHALKGLSINFRRNEFVAILGPSGCGKTTLLNITGGLDRYTSGDLIIDGISTKDYNDHDWDTYRNHSIGFVFQSYNLIAHQNVLKNVELALTISGIDKEERKRRALNALEKVGLKGLEKKKPNQLSGGQMQRVAIARALINDPEIVLADEPTGALDSETSVQIMDLLKEVAKDCLVIMVTHNPDLANTYATRIVNMKDGELLSDTNPYSDEEEANDTKDRKENPIEKENKGNKKKSSMSFFTATSLSFSNLISKLKRTILIAVAGSIGIIGVSSVLAVSNGVTSYVGRMQDDMLSNYPVTISETSIDLSSLMSGLSNWNKKDILDFDMTNSVGIDSMINYLMNKYRDLTAFKTNDINENLLAWINQIDSKYVSSISYDYGLDVTNNIYTTWNRGKLPTDEDEIISLNGLTQMYIAELNTVPNFGMYSMFVNLFTDFMSQLPVDSDYILAQYDLVGTNSRLAEKDDEIVIVVDENQTLTDFLFAQMGFFTEEEFINISKRALLENDGQEHTQEELDKYDYPHSFTFDEVLGKKLYYIPDVYDFKTLTVNQLIFTIDLGGMTDDQFKSTKFNLQYSEKGDILIGSVGGLSMVLVRKGDIPDTNKPYKGVWEGSFTINGVNVLYDLNITEDDAYISIGPIESTHATYQYVEGPMSAYMYEAFKTDEIKNNENNIQSKMKEMTITGILKKKPNVNFGSLGRGIYYTQALTDTYIKDSKDTDIVQSVEPGKEGIIDYVINKRDAAYPAYVTFDYTSYARGDTDDLVSYDVPGYAYSLNRSMSSSLSSMLSISGRGSAFIDVNREYLRSLSGLASKMTSTGSYRIEETPQSIYIYPKDFKAKDGVTNHIKKWNTDETIIVNKDGFDVELKAEEREEITYTDTVEIIVNVINTLINAITIALVAFTSLSLVVSCFMIAVITYISTMERVKEIGVIRSLGGRKKDVSRLFIAECLITGLSSGVFGIAVTYLFSLIFNLSIMQFGVGNMAILTPLTALIMIGISVLLNVLSGLIPAMHASNQDPVIALRTE